MIPFVILALIAAMASLLVVTTRNPVVSTLWLALSSVAIAGIFVVLGAPFLGVVQIIIYAGAILVFFLFVIMLLGIDRGLPPDPGGRVQRWLGLYIAAVIAIVVAFSIHASAAPVELGERVEAVVGETRALATLLFTAYVLPFELTSVLLTVAVVGAVVLGRRRPS